MTTNANPLDAILASLPADAQATIRAALAKAVAPAAVASIDPDAKPALLFWALPDGKVACRSAWASKNPAERRRQLGHRDDPATYIGIMHTCSGRYGVDAATGAGVWVLRDAEMAAAAVSMLTKAGHAVEVLKADEVASKAAALEAAAPRVMVAAKAPRTKGEGPRTAPTPVDPAMVDALKAALGGR
jgi:hypothetical protein